METVSCRPRSHGDTKRSLTNRMVKGLVDRFEPKFGLDQFRQRPVSLRRLEKLNGPTQIARGIVVEAANGQQSPYHHFRIQCH